LAAACGEALVWGPGSISQAHTTNEYNEAAALETDAAVLRRFFLAAARG
jgi:acetylornithine deacetylase/succinyl-diaminopimelate desuccinylase-like protein